MENWQPLNREQALATRDFSKAGETFIDHKGQINEILYSILTPLGYHAYVSSQMYEIPHIKGLKQGLLSHDMFLYLRGGFKWKKWK